MNKSNKKKIYFDLHLFVGLVYLLQSVLIIFRNKKNHALELFITYSNIHFLELLYDILLCPLMQSSL